MQGDLSQETATGGNKHLDIGALKKPQITYELAQEEDTTANIEIT